MTSEYIQSLTGLSPELRAVLVEMLGEIQGGGYTLPAATTSALGGVKQAEAVADPAADDVASVSASLKALTAALRTAGIMSA